MAHRRKMNVHDMYTAGIEYHAYSRVKNKHGLFGWRYVLCKPLTAEQIQAVKRWENTTISSVSYRYAPEIKYDTIIIWDKCLTVLNNFDCNGGERL
jgi:hypothetical protein